MMSMKEADTTQIVIIVVVIVVIARRKPVDDANDLHQACHCCCHCRNDEKKNIFK